MLFIYYSSHSLLLETARASQTNSSWLLTCSSILLFLSLCSSLVKDQVNEQRHGGGLLTFEGAPNKRLQQFYWLQTEVEGKDKGAWVRSQWGKDFKRKNVSTVLLTSYHKVASAEAPEEDLCSSPQIKNPENQNVWVTDVNMWKSMTGWGAKSWTAIPFRNCNTFLAVQQVWCGEGLR